MAKRPTVGSESKRDQIREEAAQVIMGDLAESFRKAGEAMKEFWDAAARLLELAGEDLENDAG